MDHIHACTCAYQYMHPKRSHMVKFFLPVSSRDYFALDPRPLRAVKNTKVGGSGGRVPTRLRAQDAKVKLFISRLIPCQALLAHAGA